jgi:hypothetical protein
MDGVTVTVLIGGWWLPGRMLKPGETLVLDAATAEGLALRGIVRLPQPEQPQNVALNAGKTRSARKEAKT